MTLVQEVYILMQSMSIPTDFFFYFVTFKYLQLTQKVLNFTRKVIRYYNTQGTGLKLDSYLHNHKLRK